MARLRMCNFVVPLAVYPTGGGQSTAAAFGDAREQLLHGFDTLKGRRGHSPDGAAVSTGNCIGADISCGSQPPIYRRFT
jgi:hypothetical protein